MGGPARLRAVEVRRGEEGNAEVRLGKREGREVWLSGGRGSGVSLYFLCAGNIG